jgi:acetyl esterase
MPLHPQAKQVLEVMAAMGLTLTGDDAAAVRKQMESFPRPEGEAVAKVEDRMVPGPGGDIPVRLYTPANATGAAMVWFHGGGWVIGSLGRDRRLRRVPAGAGEQVPGGGRRLLRGDPLGGRERGQPGN